MTTAKDLLGPAPPWQSVLRTLYSDAIAAGINVTAWAKGSPTRAMYYGASRALSSLGSQVREIANQGFRTTATKAGLTLVAKEVFGIKRPGASFATTPLLVTNSGGGLYAFGPREFIVLNPDTKKQYVNLTAFTIEPLTANIAVDIVAVEPGSASSALPGTITDLVTSLDGVTISQPTPALAVDEMPDEDLKTAAGARVGFVPTASTIGAGGAPGAYESVLRAGPDGSGGVVRPDGTRIEVTRVRIIDNGAGGVAAVVADGDGPLALADIPYLDAAIKTYAQPSGTGTAEVVNANALPYSFAYTIYVPVSAAAEPEDIEAEGAEALVEYIRSVPIGGYELDAGVFKLPLGAVRTAIMNRVGALAGLPVEVEITAPAASPTIIDPFAVVTVNGAPVTTIKPVPGV